MKSTIHINDASFTADSETIDLIVEALLEAGWSFDEQTEGYVSPEFYFDKASEDAASWGAWGMPTPFRPS